MKRERDRGAESGAFFIDLLIRLAFIFVELMSTEVRGIVDRNQMRIKLCVVFLF